jgi:hypothetical protein
LTLFALSASFVLFSLFLSRSLKALDPKTAVPTRIQTLLDTMIQGAVILDLRDNIVITNDSFAAMAFATKARLVGRSLSSLPWFQQERDEGPDEFPWATARTTGLRQKGILLRLQIGVRHTRSLTVNASPLFDTEGSLCGILVTCDDQTVIEVENLQLTQCLANMNAASEKLRRLRSGFMPASPYHVAGLACIDEVIEEIVGVCNSVASAGFQSLDAAYPERSNSSKAFPRPSNGTFAGALPHLAKEPA